MLTAFTFIRPFWLLALIPALAICVMLWRRNDPRGIWPQHIAPHLLPHLLVKGQSQSWFGPLHLLPLIWSLMVLALAGPAWRPAPSPFAASDAAVMVVLKVTPSMTATDIQPSRLDRALQKLRDFLALRGDAPTGLIVYSGSSHLVMPATTAHDVLLLMTEGLTPATMPHEGDDLAAALRQADRRLGADGAAGSILVMADNVAAPQLERMDAAAPLNYPVQILCFLPPAESDRTLKEAASLLSAQLESVTVDDRDVKSLARRAAGAFAAASGEQGAPLMQDDGYWLLPLIALGLLLWTRKGWAIQ